MRYHVSGRNETTGESRTWVIDAASPDEARQKAAALGFTVLSMSELAGSSSAPAGPAAIPSFQPPPTSRFADPATQMPWIDRQFANTSIFLLVIFSCCCGWVALIFAIVGVVACKDPRAKRNAIIVLAISGTMLVISIVFYMVQIASVVVHRGTP